MMGHHTAKLTIGNTLVHFSTNYFEITIGFDADFAADLGHHSSG